MAKFRRKRPDGEVDAIRVDLLLQSAQGDWTALPGWVRQAARDGLLLFGSDAVVIGDAITGGARRATADAWLVRTSDGVLLAVGAERFDEMFEAS
jgi:hypothetical protein